MFYNRSAHVFACLSFVLIWTLADQVALSAEPAIAADDSQQDRFWVINTRHLTYQTRRVNLDEPAFAVSRLDRHGKSSRSSFGEYIESIGQGRTAVVYVHGNRMSSANAINRGLTVYRRTRSCHRGGPIDWVMMSWPSAKQGMLIHDFRRKALRTDAQGLYLSWILRHHAQSEVPTGLIAYSFGARIVTGALHALAGGRLGGRTLPGEALKGVPFDVGLIAPAIESSWMARRGQHGLATQNLDRLVLLYNRRDAVLKRFWLLDKVRGAMALGYSGPTSFAPRADGSRLSVRARDCSPSVGIQHVELDYYRKSCAAGSEMASLINDIQVTH